MGQPKKKFKLNMMYVVPVLVIIGFIALCYVGSQKNLKSSNCN